MKRLSILAVFVFAFLIVNSSITSATTHTYTDVPETHRNYSDVTYLLELGIIPARSTYGINDLMTREDVAVMVAKALQLEGTQRATKFSDVPQSHVNSGYIQSAVEAGIINGYDDGTFKPKAKITRGHMATFIARAFTLPSGTQTFTDVPKGHTAHEAVQKLVAAGITTGYDDDTFKPAQNLSRAHISAFLTRALVYDNVHSFDIDVFLQTVYAQDNADVQLDQLDEKLTEVTALLARENSELNELLMQKKELEASITTTQQKLKSIQEKVESYHATISASNYEIQQYRSNNKHLAYGTAKQKDHYVQTLEAMQTAYATVQKEKEAALATRDKLHTFYNEQKDELNSLRTAISSKQQAIHTQNAAVTALKMASSKIHSQQQQIAKKHKGQHEQEQEPTTSISDTNHQQTTNEEHDPTVVIVKTTQPSTSQNEQEDTVEETPAPAEAPTVEDTEKKTYNIYLDHLTDDEKELAKLINEYRVSLGLKPLTISKSLTIVARTHVVDSNLHRPSSGTDARGVACNSHSWSDNGDWTPVCYTGDHEYAELMWNKPSELTDYKGNGYEISVGSSSPSTALNLWKGSSAHNNVIIGDGYWSNLTTMGIGINNGYSHIWFGVENDSAGTIE